VSTKGVCRAFRVLSPRNFFPTANFHQVWLGHVSLETCRKGFSKIFRLWVIARITSNWRGSNRHLTANSQEYECSCSLYVVIQWPGSFRGRAAFFIYGFGATGVKFSPIFTLFAFSRTKRRKISFRTRPAVIAECLIPDIRVVVEGPVGMLYAIGVCLRIFAM